MAQAKKVSLKIVLAWLGVIAARKCFIKQSTLGRSGQI